MVDIKENGKGGYAVTICHIEGHVTTEYVVTLIPDAKKMSFVTGSIKQGRNNVIGDPRRKIDHEARRQLMAHLRESLTYKKGRKRVGRVTRLDCSVVLTLADFQDNSVHTRLRMHDFRRLWAIIGKLDHEVEAATLSRKHFGKEEVPSDYLQKKKRELLVEFDKEYCLAGDNRRDLFSSIITRYYSYKGGYIDRADYDRAQALLPGFKVLWSSL
jgi:hypothetical protein